MTTKKYHRQRTLLPFRKGGRGISCLLLSLVLSACGSSGNRFSVTGKFKNFNQGEFYVYGIDGNPYFIDTIKVDRGQFAYEFFDEEPTTIVFVFPNFSELPIITEPGKSAEIKADATSLKELQVSGTSDNELMTVFRKQIVKATPDKVPPIAEKFIREHLQSRACEYIAMRYFMQGDNPDYKKAEQLLTALSEAQPENISVKRLLLKAKSLKNIQKGSPVPSFSGTDIHEKSFSSSQLKTSAVGVVTTCATWNYESTDILKRLCRLQRTSKGRLSVASVFIDGSKSQILYTMTRDSITCPMLFDPDFFDGKVLKTFGLSSIGDNVLYHNGRVYGSHFSAADLVKEVEKLLKK